MEAAAELSFDWRTAGYSEWNQQLVEYFLGVSRCGARVDRIPATPEELPGAVGDPGAGSREVVAAFVEAVRAELPPGKSFCSYCLGTPAPQFFGMLWFTCLLASGFPENTGSFRDRFRSLIGTDDQCRHGKDQRGCLNELWEELAKWTRSNERYATLVPPPIDGHLAVIGRSYYLAFPNRKDRRILADVLTSADLVGFEPPIIPVVRSIEKARGRFSPEFRGELDHFLKHYLQAGRDPTESTFWRAIRTEAAGGLLDVVEGSGAGTNRGLTFVATWDDDETLLVRLASRTSAAPDGMQARVLFVPVGCATHYLTDENGSAGAVVRLALCGDASLPYGLASLVRQGVLVFVETAAGEYRLAAGEEIDGADLALVRAERAEAFRECFGGASEESRFEGWCEIVDCKLSQLRQLPTGLAGVTQLLHTTRSPRPRIVGGIAVAGGFFWNPHFEPRIRSRAASGVSVRAGGEWLPCTPAEEPGDWSLPPTLEVVPPSIVEVQADFDIHLEDRLVRRRSNRELRFVERARGCAYKTAGAGFYWIEGCDPEQTTHEGGAAVELGVTTTDPSASADLLALDPSVRYLGPGLGEMSLEPRADHPWLAVGPKKSPHDLVFVGDLKRPIEPDRGQSENKGDRRVWARTFGTSPRRARRSTRVTARIGDEYVPLESEARLRHIYGLYRRRASRGPIEGGQERVCARATLDSCWLYESSTGFGPAEPTVQAVEVLAALGVSRSGVPLRELHKIVGRITGKVDYLLREQLIRAWSEAGLIDLLRRQDRSHTLVVPRSPRFLLVRRGPAVEARLIGLAPREVIDAIRGLLGKTALSWLAPTTPLQPPLLRLAGLEAEQVEDVSRRVGIQAPEWLSWPDAEDAPPHLAIREAPGGLRTGAPPDAYGFHARWDWRDMVFRLRPEEGEEDLVVVERRRHPERCSIFVVLVDGDPMLWCHLRSWALVRAAELWERPPFSSSSTGVVLSRGFSPMHLPLPIARLCTTLGFGLPGPDLGDDRRVKGYRYPFGQRLEHVVRRLLPPYWLADKPGEE